MKDNNDQLIKQFMQSHKHEIADGGFSEKVTNKLPKPFLRTTEIVHALGWVVLFYLLILLDLFPLLLKQIDNWVATASYDFLSSGNMLPVTLAIAVLLLLGVQKACSVK